MDLETAEMILCTVATHLVAFATGLLLTVSVCSLVASRAPGPVTCHFDGGGTSVAGSVTSTDDSRPWLCTDDGSLVPWTGHLPTGQNN